MEDITKKPLIDLFTEMTYLEQEIGLKQLRHEREIELLILKYEKMRLEIIRRFPIIEQEETFKPLTKEKILNGRNI